MDVAGERVQIADVRADQPRGPCVSDPLKAVHLVTPLVAGGIRQLGPNHPSWSAVHSPCGAKIKVTVFLTVLVNAGLVRTGTVLRATLRCWFGV